MASMEFSNTDECFTLATLKEFVKLWGSGRQARLNLECCDGTAWANFSFQLGHPSQQHYVHQAPAHRNSTDFNQKS